MWLFIKADVCVSRIQLCSKRLLTGEESVVLHSRLTQVPADTAGAQPGMDYTHKSKMREKAEREILRDTESEA